MLKPEFKQRFGLIKLGLFGSFAKDQAHSESDIDIVVELQEPDIFALVHIKQILEDDFQRSVDVIPFTHLMNTFLKNRIEKEAIYV